jgi:hypothetical protein
MARGWKINSQKVVLTNSGTLFNPLFLPFLHFILFALALYCLFSYDVGV